MFRKFSKVFAMGNLMMRLDSGLAGLGAGGGTALA